MNKKQNYEDLFEEAKSFAEKTFVTATTETYLAKLREEQQELECDLCIEELADCMLVLVALSRLVPGDLKQAISRKIEINKNRTWEKMPDGTYHHC